MWTKFCKSTIGKVNVAFNKVSKVFMNVPSYSSPSWLLLICDVMNFLPLKLLIIEFLEFLWVLNIEQACLPNLL